MTARSGGEAWRGDVLQHPHLWDGSRRTLRLQRFHLAAALATVIAFSGIHVLVAGSGRLVGWSLAVPGPRAAPRRRPDGRGRRRRVREPPRRRRVGPRGGRAQSPRPSGRTADPARRQERRVDRARGVRLPRARAADPAHRRSRSRRVARLRRAQRLVRGAVRDADDPAPQRLHGWADERARRDRDLAVPGAGRRGAARAGPLRGVRRAHRLGHPRRHRRGAGLLGPARPLAVPPQVPWPRGQGLARRRRLGPARHRRVGGPAVHHQHRRRRGHLAQRPGPRRRRPGQPGRRARRDRSRPR